MKYIQKYTNFGKIEYFSENLVVSPEYYLECGKIYSRNNYSQIVNDLFPYEILSEYAKNNFLMTSSNTPEPFTVETLNTITVGGQFPFHATNGGYVRAANPGIALINTGYKRFILDNYTLEYGLGDRGTLSSITVDAFFPELNKGIELSHVDNYVSKQNIKVSNLSILMQKCGFNQLRLSVYYGCDNYLGYVIKI